MSFSSLGLPAYLIQSLEKHNYSKPYPIQEMAIPAIIAGKDILGIAQTGSGKTASYVLPILTLLEGVKAPSARHIKVLVIVPTRELAVQVVEVFKQFATALPFKCTAMAVYGGASVNVQMQALNNVSVLVATPGRLLDLLGSNAVHLSAISTLVLDEADKMLNIGFKKEMDEILTFLPKSRQNLLFSATLSPNIEDIKQVLLQEPLVINIAPEAKSIDLINQTAYAVTSEQKGPLLRYLINKNNSTQILIFTSSVKQADTVVSKLNKNKIDAKVIHSKKSQHARTEALNSFKSGKLRVLVATDLLARGIDIQFLPCVINYELPRSPKDYVHRIGRTGRAENPGEAISFITPDDEHHFKVIQKKMKKSVDIIANSVIKELLDEEIKRRTK
jgi:ATP-dependent RNA helicase RhlE